MIYIRQIEASDWRKYRDVRLHALRDAPNAFGSTYETEKSRTDETWSAQIEAAISSGRDCALFAISQEEVCGLVWCNLSESHPDTAHIYQMWVDPATRRLGAGYKLLDTAVSWAQKKGVSRVRLSVTDAEGPAIGLYKKYGFLPTGCSEPLREGSDIEVQILELRNCLR